MTSRLARDLVDEVLLVDETQIEEAVCLLLAVEKTLTEGAGAAGLAALLAYPRRFAGKRVGLVLCGGNIDQRLLSRAFSVKTESPKMLYPFDFEPVLIRKPPTLFGNRL